MTCSFVIIYQEYYYNSIFFTGSGKARMKGVYESTAEYIVFLDTNTIVNTGWLEPLIDLVQKEETTIAVPHFDNVNDPVSYEYSTTSTNLITGKTSIYFIGLSDSKHSLL